MATEILFSPIGSVTTPFVKELHSYTPDTITFDGYFYMEDGAMPVERLLYVDGVTYHIEIYEKKMLRETSFDDSTTAEDEETICFFPTGILQLKYRQIKRLSSREERQQATARIEGLEAEVRRRNQVLETQRRRQEQERLEELAKNIDFKSFFAQYMPQEGGDPLRRTQ